MRVSKTRCGFWTGGEDLPGFGEGIYDTKTDAACTSGDESISSLELSPVNGFCEVDLLCTVERRWELRRCCHVFAFLEECEVYRVSVTDEWNWSTIPHFDDIR